MSGCVTAASWVCPSVGCLIASLFTCRADSEEEDVTKPIMCQIKGVQGVADPPPGEVFRNVSGLQMTVVFL